ncbi:MAG: DUF4446 family protein [Acidimicrobiia bacterium]|jgi:hypothetical protein
MIEIAMAVAIVALVGVIVIAAQTYALRRRFSAMPADQNIFAILRGIDNELGRLDTASASMEPRLARAEAILPRAIVNTGIVNYDAFGDIAGNLSRSMALLSLNGDGVVLTIMVGRLDVRVFTKEVRGFRGVEELSPEEDEAVARARG